MEETQNIITKEIADKLELSTSTVVNQIARISKKLEVRNRLEIAYFAMRDGIVEFGSDEPRLRWEGLTEREDEIVPWRARGYFDKEIASMLEIKPSTLKKHLSNIYEKIGLKNHRALAYHAIPEGFMEY